MSERRSIREMRNNLETPDPDGDCARCRQHMHAPAEYEKTALCNACAQWFVAEVTPDLFDVAGAALLLKTWHDGDERDSEKLNDCLDAILAAVSKVRE